MSKMIWSIFKNSSLPYERWEECHVAWFVDEDLENASPMNCVKFLHDGFYPIYYGDNWIQAQVKDGKFVDIEALKADIGKIVEMAGYWGQYIERFYKKDGKINVIIGS